MILEMLSKKISEALIDLDYKTEVKIIKSNRPELCDYQYDGVFKLASMYKKNPIEIGESLVLKINDLKDFSDYFDKVEFVKPGFINITLSNKLINKLIIKMNSDDKFGIEEPFKKETFFLDYGGPNIAKPLHVGHLRSAIVGESVKRIIKFVGHNTISDVHLGDIGLQIGQVIYGVKKYNKKVEEIDLDFLEKIYPEISILCKEDETVKEECALITKKLQDGIEEYTTLWKKICNISGNDIKRLYKYIDVSFDLWYGESDAHPYIAKVEEIVKGKNLLVNSEGAKVIDIKRDTDSKELPPLIFQKSNGGYLYGTTDMATIYQRSLDYNIDHILYFTDLRQNLHFEQVFRACDKAQIFDYSKLEFLGFGTVNGSDGKPYKTRSGDAPKLDDLFNEVKEVFTKQKESNVNMSTSDLDIITNAIIKFADLQNNREKDYIFDITKFSEVVGKTGPYILYTYLRINKIIKDFSVYNLSENIYNNFDRDLRKKIIEFDLSLNLAFETRLPSLIAEYTYDLCVLINAFYQNNHIMGIDDETKKNDWIYLLNLSNKILKQLFDMLIIDIPTVM